MEAPSDAPSDAPLLEVPEARPAPRRGRFRAAGFVAVAIGVLTAGQRFIPHEQHLEIDLGEAAVHAVHVNVGYLEGGETLREVAFGFRDGQAPRVIRHSPSLRNGRYDVTVEVEHADGTHITSERSLCFNEDGTTRFLVRRDR